MSTLVPISFVGGNTVASAIAGGEAVAGKRHRIKGWFFTVVAVGAQNAAGAQIVLYAGATLGGSTIIASAAFGPADADKTRIMSYYGPCDVAMPENTPLKLAYSTAGAETCAVVGHVEIGFD